MGLNCFLSQFQVPLLFIQLFNRLVCCRSLPQVCQIVFLPSSTKRSRIFYNLRLSSCTFCISKVEITTGFWIIARKTCSVFLRKFSNLSCTTVSCVASEGQSGNGCETLIVVAAKESQRLLYIVASFVLEVRRQYCIMT